MEIIERVKESIVHLFGGFTLEECEEASHKAFKAGKKSVLFRMNNLAVKNYGKDWSNEMYSMIEKELKELM